MSAALIDVRLVRRVQEALDICAFELADASGAPLPPFEAGAHIDVHLPGGLVRQYSLCGDPDEHTRYVIGVLREPASRGGSAVMHALHEGEHLRIGAPRNLFALAHNDAPSLLLAGGIGITPILCMARTLFSEKRAFRLHYCVRSRERAAFATQIAHASWQAQAHMHVDDGPPHQRLDLARELMTCDPATHLYVCGPGGFIAWALRIAAEAGWPEAQVHREHFAAASRGEDDRQAGAFDVRIASSGATVRVAPGQSVVQALRSIGVEVPVSCEQGLCGTCLVGVLDGEPEHRDVFLTDPEKAAGDRFTPCCSRSKSACLVLDL